VSGRRSKPRREPIEAEAVPEAVPIPAPAIRTSVSEVSASENPVRYFPGLLLLLAGSGCAALTWEIVWFQLLQLVIGSSAVSLGLLLAAYMGGLCLGSAVLPRFVSAREHPLRVYAFLELGIGVFGILALFGVPLVGRIYLAGAGSGLFGLVIRGVVAAVCLLPPTILMGASLPAIARWVEATPRGVSRLGLLYSANIAGAVVGCVFTGFYLLRVHNMAVATYTAAAINGAVALLGFLLATRTRRGPATISEDPARRASGAVFIYVAIAFSGMTALGAEVVWTRLLSLMLGATVYTFSIILAVFLFGLWGGSTVGSMLARRVRDARIALGVCQILLAAAIAFTAWTLTYVLPYWPVDPWLSINPWFNFDLDVARSIRAILPATLLWGASFPLALAAAAAGDEDPARLTGEVYAANTAGSIVGALAFSLLLIPWLGTKGSQQLLIWLAAAGAVFAIAPVAIALPRTVLRFAGAVAAALALAWAFAATVAPVPWQVLAYGRRSAPILHNVEISTDPPAMPVFTGEGISSSVVIAERTGQRFFYVSGKSEASSAILDMRLQRMMGHLPALFHAEPGPQSVLVVGFGAGVTAGSFVPYPSVRNIVICELEPIIPPASNEFFGKENYNVLTDRRTRMVYDDARHYISRAAEKFDVITTDPIHPWVKGTSTLYSREYYELVKSHLNPGGVAAQWLPIYESDKETVETELATFFSVFPHATVWSNYLNGDGYDLVLLGRPDDSPIDADRLQSRLGTREYSAVAASLTDVGFKSAVDLLTSYAGRASDLQPMLAGAQINRDMNMRLQYIAGMGLNSVTSPQLYGEILSYRKFPGDLLTGSPERLDALREVLERRRRTF
jgi:spermidine synthase